MSKPTLSPKQQAFVDAYLSNGRNATRAAITAGYSKKMAGKIGPRMVGNSRIARVISARLEAASRRSDITCDRWLAEYALVAFSDLADYIDIDPDTGAIRAKAFDGSGMPKGASRALESITEVRTIHESANGEQSVVNSRITFKLHPKIQALRDLGEYFGWLKKDNRIAIPGVEAALYEISEKFMPKVVKRGHAK